MKIEVIIDNILELFIWLHRMLILGNLNTYKMKISMTSERVEYDKKYVDDREVLLTWHVVV